MKKSLFIIAILTLATTITQGQRPSVISPEVHPDNSVTFRFFAANAQKVTLEAQFLTANKPMTKDASGVWSITVAPVKPDIYPYAFWVDSVQVADPNNTLIFANERFKY